MEVRINREIREYTESMFFGLSMRQFFFSVLAIIAAVGFYFALRPVLPMETVSWVCILAAVPFGAMGFIKYNGMTAEQFVIAWIRSQILMPKRLLFGKTEKQSFLYRYTASSTLLLLPETPVSSR